MRVLALQATRHDVGEARKALTRLEDPGVREEAQTKDARAAVDAKRAGKTVPKRVHAATLDREIEDAKHAVRVASLTEADAFKAFEATLQEHESEWIAEVVGQLGELDARWLAALTELDQLNTARNLQLDVKRGVGEDQHRNSQIFVPRGLLRREEDNQGRPIHFTDAGTLLDLLRGYAMPQAPEAKTPVKHPPLKGLPSPNIEHQGVQKEIAEREAVEAVVRVPSLEAMGKSPVKDADLKEPTTVDEAAAVLARGRR